MKYRAWYDMAMNAVNFAFDYQKLMVDTLKSDVPTFFRTFDPKTNIWAVSIFAPPPPGSHRNMIDHLTQVARTIFHASMANPKTWNQPTATNDPFHVTIPSHAVNPRLWSGDVSLYNISDYTTKGLWPGAFGKVAGSNDKYAIFVKKEALWEWFEYDSKLKKSVNPDMQGTLYEILGVAEGATDGVIRSGYKKMALVHHPDRGGNTDDFQRIKEAYDRLSDERARKKYDLGLRFERAASNQSNGGRMPPPSNWQPPEKNAHIVGTALPIFGKRHVITSITDWIVGGAP